MRWWSSVRRATTVIGAAVIIIAVSLQSAPAQHRLTVSEFLANPGRLLQLYPNGGPGMIAEIRDLAVSDKATLEPILSLLPTADKYQKIATGRALAEAARIIVKTNPAYATEIQEAILKTKDQDVVLAFTIASGNRELGTVGGGAGGGGGASGGQTNPLSQTGGSNSGGGSAGSNSTATGTGGIGGVGATGGGGGSGTTSLTSSTTP